MLNTQNQRQQLRDQPLRPLHVLHLDLEVDKLINYFTIKQELIKSVKNEIYVYFLLSMLLNVNHNPTSQQL